MAPERYYASNGLGCSWRSMGSTKAGLSGILESFGYRTYQLDGATFEGGQLNCDEIYAVPGNKNLQEDCFIKY
jgi:hypothetical protein